MVSSVSQGPCIEEEEVFVPPKRHSQADFSVPSSPSLKSDFNPIPEHGFEIKEISKGIRSGFTYTATIELANKKIYYIDMTETVARNGDAAAEYLRENAAKILKIGIENGVGLGGKEKAISCSGTGENIHYFSTNIASTQYLSRRASEELEKELANYFSADGSENNLAGDFQSKIKKEKEKVNSAYLRIFKDWCKKEEDPAKITSCEGLQALITRVYWIIESEKIDDFEYPVSEIVPLVDSFSEPAAESSVVESEDEQDEIDEEEYADKEEYAPDENESEQPDQEEVKSNALRFGESAGAAARYVVQSPQQCAHIASSLAAAAFSRAVNGSYDLANSIAGRIRAAGQEDITGSLRAVGTRVVNGLSAVGARVGNDLLAAGETFSDGLSAAGTGLAHSGRDFKTGFKVAYAGA